MRILSVAAVALILSACSGSGAKGGYAISTSDAPVPGRKTIKQPEKPRSKTPVERWTREQRLCEVGDRKDQRRCVMPHPGG